MAHSILLTWKSVGSVRGPRFVSTRSNPSLSQVLQGEDIGLEEVGDSLWNIVYYSTRCWGKIDERSLTHLWALNNLG